MLREGASQLSRSDVIRASRVRNDVRAIVH